MATAKNKRAAQPVLRWETVETEREMKGILHSTYLVERARVGRREPGVTRWKYTPGPHNLA